MRTFDTKIDRDDIAVELLCLSNLCAVLAGPLVESDNRAPDETMGSAIAAVGHHLRRISEDVSYL